MARGFNLALVDRTDNVWSSTFARKDETLFSFKVQHDEGGFCGLTAVIKRPSQALLDPARKQWVWLSMTNGATHTPLFFGRVVGLPDNLYDELVSIEFIAKPADFEAQKNAVAATLRVSPYWDYAFVDPQQWEDPDAVLDSRTDVWHVDRLGGTVTISSIITGEDGTISIGSSLISSGGLDVSYSEAPLRKVNLELRAMWTQVRRGALDITADILAAFAAVGSNSGFVTSYTGQGLYDDWPEEGASIGGIYQFGVQTIEVADGKSLSSKVKKVPVKYDSQPTDTSSTTSVLKDLIVKFRRWGFKIQSFVNYDCEIERTEDIRFTVLADVQAMINDPDDEQSETITISSGAVGTSVGPVGSEEIPIGDVARAQFWPLQRGLRAIEFGLTHSRALLMRRARAAQVAVTIPFDTAITATCRKSATITHPAIVGGSATGKIVSYSFGVDGNTGREQGQLTIACMVGNNSTFAAVAGTPVYVSPTYVGSDYQQFTGSIAYESGIAMNYELPSWSGLFEPDIGVQSVVVTGGETEQENVLDNKFIDIDAACDALNAHPTVVDLHMKPVDTSPRDLRYNDSIVNLSIPMGINLGAV